MASLTGTEIKILHDKYVSISGMLPVLTQDVVLAAVIENKSLDSYPDASVNEALKAILLRQHGIIQDLTQEIEAFIETAQENLDDSNEKLSDAVQSFRKTLAGAPIKHLYTKYDLSYLTQLRPETRKLICQELIEYAESLKMKPSELWSNIVSANGSV